MKKKNGARGGKQWEGRLRRAGRWAVRLLYPPRCPLCDRILPITADGVCPECEDKLPWVRQPYCLRCGTMIDSPRREYCEDCLARPRAFDQGIAVFCYTGRMRQSVQRIKFDGRREYLDFYASVMAKKSGRWLALWKPDVIIPVPMHWLKKNRRGFNQSELLARKLGKQTGIPVRPRAVRKRRDTRAQKDLSARERRENLRGAFEAAEDLSHVRSALIVDDVYTTGSTVEEVSRVLRKAGVRHVYFLVLCTGKGKKAVCTDENLCYNERR